MRVVVTDMVVIFLAAMHLFFREQSSGFLLLVDVSHPIWVGICSDDFHLAFLSIPLLPHF